MGESGIGGKVEMIKEVKAMSKFPQICFCGFLGNVEMKSHEVKSDGKVEVKWTCPICGKEREGDGRDW